MITTSTTGDHVANASLPSNTGTIILPHPLRQSLRRPPMVPHPPPLTPRRPSPNTRHVPPPPPPPPLPASGTILNCPHHDHSFKSPFDLVSPLRIHRTETGKPVPGALT
ncbi:unnamed protein product [Schistocephalus solidus]|uniref:Uncharacterized protein n=1 Tax=Schistocephalus solidus TaxID=70667 RepID=A0A183SSC7_SCHSO|nr:unnamed protein product [Schistocephalus solidus]